MQIVSIGGGPAGLFFAILMQKAFPQAAISVHERNRADDTFGWGVVFSKETLGNIADADPESYQEIRDHFIYWDDIDTHYRGTKVTSTGHGFCGLSRKTLLLILQQRCRQLGITLHFQSEIPSWQDVAKADLVLAADGVNSKVRSDLEASFRPDLDWRKCKFAWFGTDKPLQAFTFVFAETEHGLFQVHAYPFENGLSTWIVECREEVWRKAGLDQLDEVQSAAFCERLFATHLRGHRLLCNRSLWRTFPTIRCQSWVHENVVLVGDAAHTAHFSIGSGTKLAMEDVMALTDTFKRLGPGDVSAVLREYERQRLPEVLRLQRAAQTSLEWFENSARYVGQDPSVFQFNLMTRSKRITYDNLRVRDPQLVSAVNDAVAGRKAAPPPMFLPLQLRGLELRNRVVVSPMCQYSAQDGTPDEWHLVHLGSRAVGGAGLVITEMTNVSADGRITPGCTGMYTPGHTAAWRRIVEFVHRHTPAKIGMQLAHAGRKGSVTHPWSGSDDVPLAKGGWQTLGPSALPFRKEWPAPKAMDRGDMDRVRDAFVRATRQCDEAGFDLVELHMAHGYLLSSFLSPLSNRRSDEYGGPLARRMRFPLEVFAAVRAAWPSAKPLAVRLSATDWLPDGFQPHEAVEVARALKELGCDVIDVSTAGNVPESKPEYGRMYQLPFAEQIRYEAAIPVMSVGGIFGWDHCNTILAAGRADLCVLARPHLRDPYLTLHAADAYGLRDQWWPPQYLAGRSLQG